MLGNKQSNITSGIMTNGSCFLACAISISEHPIITVRGPLLNKETICVSKNVYLKEHFMEVH